MRAKERKRKCAIPLQLYERTSACSALGLQAKHLYVQGKTLVSFACGALALQASFRLPHFTEHTEDGMKQRGCAQMPQSE